MENTNKTNVLIEILGNNLVYYNKIYNSMDTLSTNSVIKDKIIGLYFAAQWCPPCNEFCDMLMLFYDSIKQKYYEEQCPDLEIVLVSSDRNELEFNKHFKSMPWKAIPYENKSTITKLSKLFKIEGVPVLIFFNQSGFLIAINGRDKITIDPLGNLYPWDDRPYFNPQGDYLIDKFQNHIDYEVLVGKYIGLYFCAKWCVPCNSFTAKLIKFYESCNSNSSNQLEIIFVTSDESYEDYIYCTSRMPWLALPYPNLIEAKTREPSPKDATNKFNDPVNVIEITISNTSINSITDKNVEDIRIDKNRRNQLKLLYEQFNIDNIPQFVLIGLNGKIITMNGKEFVEKDPNGCEFPYYPKYITELVNSCENLGYNIRKIPSLVLLLDDHDISMNTAQYHKIKDILSIISYDYHQKHSIFSVYNGFIIPTLLFFISNQANEFSSQIKSFTNGHRLSILDISSKGSYYLPNYDNYIDTNHDEQILVEDIDNHIINESVINKFISDFMNGLLLKRSIK